MSWNKKAVWNSIALFFLGGIHLWIFMVYEKIELRFAMLLWLLLMPPLAAFIRNKEEGIGSLFKEWGIWFLVGFGYIILIRYTEEIALVLEGFFQIFGISKLGSGAAFIILGFPLGLLPFVQGEVAKQLLKDDGGAINILRAHTLLIIYLFIYLIGSFIVVSPKIEATINNITSYYNVDGETTIGSKAKKFFLEFWILVFQRGTDFLTSIPGKAGEIIKQEYEERVLGKIPGFASKSDRESKIPVGIYVNQELKATEENNIFTTDQQTILYTSIKAETLSKPILLNISCYAQDSKTKQIISATQIYPSDNFDISMFEEESIDCIFEPGVLAPGRYLVYIIITYEFDTTGSKKTYFSDKDTLRAEKIEGIDTFEKNQITDRSPAPSSSNGPLDIVIGFGRELPISLDRKLSQQRYTLNARIKNEWGDEGKGNGKIKNMTNVILFVPKGFEALSIQGIHAEKVECNDIPDDGTCDDSLINIYTIDPGTTIKDEYDYRMYLSVDQDEYDTVLGTTPVATRFFGMYTEYVYQLTKTKYITIQAPEGGQASTPSQTVATESALSFVAPAYEATGITDTSVTITWNTNKNSTGVAYVWPSEFGSTRPGFALSSPSQTLKTSHSAIVSGLESNTNYAFEVAAVDHNNITINSRLKTFKTTAGVSS